MSEETRMVIITSNDDLIRQLAQNQWQKTLLIDLDAQPSTTTRNGNLLNWNLFAELSQLNRTTDHVYQQILSSPPVHRRKASKRFSNSICAICGGKAIGFNYDVLSCAPCKAFFRRNAQHSIDKLSCTTGQGKCNVGNSISRKCPRCRLERCLEQGMRKDFILTDEERQRRQQRLEEKRRQSTITHQQEQQQQREDLSLEDWLEIEKIKSSYSMAFDTEYEQTSHLGDVHDHRSTIASWSNLADRVAMRLIQFFRQVDQFEELNADDRFFLVKSNIFPIFILHKSTKFNYRTETFDNLSTEDQHRVSGYFKINEGQDSTTELFFNLILSISLVTEGDSILIYLLLVILLFTNNLPINPRQGILHDPLAVYRAQSYFTQLMINYLRQKHGEERSQQLLIQLFFELARLSKATENLQRFFRSQVESYNELVQNITPLMHTVLNIN